MTIDDVSMTPPVAESSSDSSSREGNTTSTIKNTTTSTTDNNNTNSNGDILLSRSKVVHRIHTKSSIPATDTSVYIISAKWFNKWLHYVKQDESYSTSPPGVIDNQDLLANALSYTTANPLLQPELTPNILDFEYTLVSKTVWNSLAQDFGVKDPSHIIIRPTGPSALSKVDLYPVAVTFYPFIMGGLMSTIDKVELCLHGESLVKDTLERVVKSVWAIEGDMSASNVQAYKIAKSVFGGEMDETDDGPVVKGDMLTEYELNYTWKKLLGHGPKSGKVGVQVVLDLEGKLDADINGDEPPPLVHGYNGLSKEFVDSDDENDVKKNDDLMSLFPSSNTAPAILSTSTSTSTSTSRPTTTITYKGSLPPAPAKPTMPAYDLNKMTWTPGLVGLQNLGNTCFMNSALQCLSNTAPLTHYFLSRKWEEEINRDNPLGMHGEIAEAYSGVVHSVWSPFAPTGSMGSYGSRSSISPRMFKTTIGRFNAMFQGYHQHDSQELLGSLLDGLHEDLNRIKKKPYVENPEFDVDVVPDSQMADSFWNIYKQRNDSIIVDLFQGQYKSRVTCVDCGKKSVTFDPFMFLSVPVPERREVVISVIAIPAYNSDKLESQRPRKIDIKLPKDARIKNLKDKVAEKLGWGSAEERAAGVVPETWSVSKDIAVVEFWHSKVYKMFDAYDSVSSINTNTDVIAVVQLGNSGILGAHSESSLKLSKELVHLPMYFNMSPDDPNVVVGAQLFGQPATLALPLAMEVAVPSHFSEDDKSRYARVIAGDLLYREVMSAIRKYTKNTDSMDMDLEHGLFGIRYGEGSTSRASYSRDVFANSANTFLIYDPADRELPTVEEQETTEAKDKEVEMEKEMEMIKLDFDPSAQIVLEFTQSNAVKLFGEVILKNKEGGAFIPDCDPSDVVVGGGDGIAAGLRSKTKEKRDLSLYECISEFTKEEELGDEDTWYCPNCKAHRKVVKKMDIWKVPDVLVVHLKRFSNASRAFSSYSFMSLSGGDKIDSLVDAPIDGLDLRNIVVGQDYYDENGNAKNEDLIYDLFAISNHFGGTGGGHYTAYAKNAVNGKWYNLDDSCVSPLATDDPVLTSAAYMLFYVRRGKHWLQDFRPQLQEVLNDMASRFEKELASSTSSSSSSGLVLGSVPPPTPGPPSAPSFAYTNPARPSFGFSTPKETPVMDRLSRELGLLSDEENDDGMVMDENDLDIQKNDKKPVFDDHLAASLHESKVPGFGDASVKSSLEGSGFGFGFASPEGE